MGWHIPIIGDLISSVGGYFKERQVIKAEEKKRKDELKTLNLNAKIEQIRNAQESDIKMDNEARGMAGYMDDISFYLFLVPVPLAFFPDMVPHIEAGFEVLESMPEAYQYALGLMLAAVWGYRRLIVPIVDVVVKQYVKKFGG